MLNSSFIDAMKNTMENLAEILHMPYVSYMLYPFILVVQELSDFQIDFNG